MSDDKDHSPPETPEVSDEAVKRAMEEAAAAVEAVRGDGEEDAAAEVIEIIDEEPVDPVAELKEALEKAQSEKSALRDKWLRAVADLENYKKRVKRDIDEAVGREVQKVLEGFFPVADNMGRALDSATDEDSQLATGVKMVFNEFFSALSRQGIDRVETVGHPFDPAIHDALQQIDSDEFAPGIVVQEFEKGYRRAGRLLRPARVIVAGPGSTGTTGGEPAEHAESGEQANEDVN